MKLIANRECRAVHRREAGFTLFEIAVALTVLGLLASLILPMLAQSTDNAQRADTERKLRDLKQTLLSAYRQNAYEIDSDAGNHIMTGGVEVLSNGSTATESTFAWMERYASASTAVLAKDGFGVPVRVFVSNRLAEVYNGTTLYNHKVAIVSAGVNGRIDDGTTFDPVSGKLTLKGDDMAEVIDGFQIQRELFETTKRRVEKIADAYQAYFLTRYQSNESRNLNINYFVNGSRGNADAAMFDSSGAVPSSGGADSKAETLFAGTLGLAGNDFKDGYGNPIMVDNSSDAVRTPDNSNAAMNTPPYTAIIKTTLAGGDTFAQAVVGSY